MWFHEVVVFVPVQLVPSPSTHLNQLLCGVLPGLPSAFQCLLAVLRCWNPSVLCPNEAQTSYEVSSPKEELSELARAIRGCQVGCLQPCWPGNRVAPAGEFLNWHRA